jgi:hypothetical protein
LSKVSQKPSKILQNEKNRKKGTLTNVRAFPPKESCNIRVNLLSLRNIEHRRKQRNKVLSITRKRNKPPTPPPPTTQPPPPMVRLPVGDMQTLVVFLHVFVLSVVAQGTDDVAQRQQSLIDVDTFVTGKTGKKQTMHKDPPPKKKTNKMIRLSDVRPPPPMTRHCTFL